jgi:hypothetical protein
LQEKSNDRLNISSLQQRNYGGNRAQRPSVLLPRFYFFFEHQKSEKVAVQGRIAVQSK